MQAYQGYYKAGQFQTHDGSAVLGQGQAVLLFIETLPDWKESDGCVNEQLAAFDEFISDIQDCGEEVPVFKRARLHREADL